MNIIKDNQYIKKIVLPTGLRTIGDYAFQNCSYLEQVTLPEVVFRDVVTVAAMAFFNSPLESVSFEAAGSTLSAANSITSQSGTTSLQVLHNETNNKAAGTYKRTKGSGTSFTAWERVGGNVTP
ncbi:MAG: leucine-rich repeat domain-containing protein [Treponema sp.]|jgi:hypothetical protein|nr:leucine-rich repeat domain-containing protein [Treponema sp.]